MHGTVIGVLTVQVCDPFSRIPTLNLKFFPSNEGFTKAKSIANPKQSFKVLLLNSPTSDDSSSVAVFRAHTNNRLNSTIQVSSVLSGEINPGMSFITVGPMGENKTATLIACSLTEGIGSCLLNCPVSLKFQTELTAKMIQMHNDEIFVTTNAIDAHQTIYITRQNNATLFAFHPSGSLKWKLIVENRDFKCAYSPPVVGYSEVSSIFENGISIYILSSEGELFSTDTSGSRKWKYSLSSAQIGALFKINQTMEIPAPLVIANDIFVSHANNRYVYSIKSDGTLSWKFKAVGNISLTPAAHSFNLNSNNFATILYIADSKNHIYALNWSHANTTNEPSLKWYVFYLMLSLNPMSY